MHILNLGACFLPLPAGEGRGEGIPPNTLVSLTFPASPEKTAHEQPNINLIVTFSNNCYP
jgi:hypothetical protein